MSPTLLDVSRTLREVDNKLAEHKTALSHQNPISSSIVNHVWQKVHDARGVAAMMEDGVTSKHIISSNLQDVLSEVRGSIRKVVEHIAEVMMNKYAVPRKNVMMVGSMLDALKKHLKKEHPGEVDILKFVVNDLQNLQQDTNEPHHQAMWLQRDHVLGFLREGPLLKDVLTKFLALVPQTDVLPEVYFARMELLPPLRLTTHDPWGDACFDTLRASDAGLQKLQGLQRRRSRFTEPSSFHAPGFAAKDCAKYFRRLARSKAFVLSFLSPGQGREEAARVMASEQITALLHASIALHRLAKNVYSWEAGDFFQDAAGMVRLATSIAEEQGVPLPGTDNQPWAPSLCSLCQLIIVQGQECAFSWEARRARRSHLLGSHALTIFGAYNELENYATDLLGFVGHSIDDFKQFVSFKKQQYLAEACFHAEPTIRKDAAPNVRANLLADAQNEAYKLKLDASDKKVMALFGDHKSYKPFVDGRIKQLQGFEEDTILKNGGNRGDTSRDFNKLKTRLEICYNHAEVALAPTTEDQLTIFKKRDHYAAATNDGAASSASSDEGLPCRGDPCSRTSAQPLSTPLHAPTATPSIAEWWKANLGNAPSKPAKQMLDVIRKDKELSVYLNDQEYKSERELRLLTAVLHSKAGHTALAQLGYSWADGASGLEFMFLSRLLGGQADRNRGKVDERDLIRLHKELGATTNDMASMLKMAIDSSSADKAAEILGSQCSKLFYVWGCLNVSAVVDSFDMEALKESFVEGTRDWLMSALSKWLDHAEERMFLLVAKPAMGKSVFCAKVCEKLEEAPSKSSWKQIQVHHYFRMGQASAEGKAMVLALAHQLADQLPGMLDQLCVAASESTRAIISRMDMGEAFDRFLLGPLQALDGGTGPAEQHASQCKVVMVVDALDEAADGKQDWLTVVEFMAKKFVELPPWVRVVLSTRPSTTAERVGESSKLEVPAVLQQWKPTVVQIDPEAGQNTADLKQICRKMLEDQQRAARLAPAEDIEEALEILIEKCQGQMIYPRFVGSILDEPDRPAMGVASMRETLPSGLFGMYEYVVGELRRSMPHADWSTLSTSMLPVLAASKVPLTLQQLAVILKKEVYEVEDFRQRMCGMFHLEPAATLAQCTVVTVHATVLEWLGHARSLSFYSGITPGHRLISYACAKALLPDLGSCKVLEQYALQHAVSHFSAAAFRNELKDVALDFTGFWQRVFAEGHYSTIISFFNSPLLSGSHNLLDVALWLQQNAQLLLEYPEATVQLACDALSTTSVAKHAREKGYQPQAMLQNKPNNWPSIRAFSFPDPLARGIVLQGLPLAVHTGCSTIVAAHGDLTGASAWDLRSGVRKGSFYAETSMHSYASIAAFSHSGDFCVIGLYDNSLWKCNTQDLSCLASMCDIRVRAECVRLAISCDDGHCIAVYADSLVGIWDLHSSTLQHLFTLEAAAFPRARDVQNGSKHIITSEIRPSSGAALLAYLDEAFTTRVVDLLSFDLPPKACIDVISGNCWHSEVSDSDGNDSAFEGEQGDHGELNAGDMDDEGNRRQSRRAGRASRHRSDFPQMAVEDIKLALTSERLFAAIPSAQDRSQNTIIRMFNWVVGEHLMDVPLYSEVISKLMPLPDSRLLVRQFLDFMYVGDALRAIDLEHCTRILNASTGEVLHKVCMKQKGRVGWGSWRTIVIADQATCVVSDNSGMIRVLDVNKLRSDGALPEVGEQAYDRTLGFALLSGTSVCVQLVSDEHKTKAIFRTWDMATGTQLNRDQEAPHVHLSAGHRFSSDGSVCATASDHCYQIWSMQPGGVSLLLQTSRPGIDIHLVCADNGIHLAQQQVQQGIPDVDIVLQHMPQQHQITALQLLRELHWSLHCWKSPAVARWHMLKESITSSICKPLTSSSASSSAPCSPALWYCLYKCNAVCYTSQRLEGNRRVLEKATVYLQPPHTLMSEAAFFSLDNLTLLVFVDGAAAPLCYKLMPMSWLQDSVSSTSSEDITHVAIKKLVRQELKRENKRTQDHSMSTFLSTNEGGQQKDEGGQRYKGGQQKDEAGWGFNVKGAIICIVAASIGLLTPRLRRLLR